MNISVVVPVYNSQYALAELVFRLQSILKELANEYELILVNDASKDQSWAVICDLASQHSRVRGIDLMRNYGQHNALLCGIRAASYEIIITMDDDLQHPPEEIPKLLDKLNEGFDVVYGTPHQEQHGLWRNLASIFTKMALQSVMGVETGKKVSAFRAFRRKISDAFTDFRGPFVSIDVLLTWGTTKFAAVRVQRDLRNTGRSNYTFFNLVTHALNMMTGFSTLPLQIASLVGFGFMAFGISIFIFVIFRYLAHGGSVPGFPFLASIIAIFSGAQLLAMGIFGEYLARMYFRILNRPSYVIRSSSLHNSGVGEDDRKI